jgi:hypothetical protein
MSKYNHPLGTIAKIEEQDINELNENLRGDLILPDHEDYEDTRNVWNGLVNKYPAVIVRAKGGVDVAYAVEFARNNDLELAIRGGSHHQTGSAMVDNGLVVDLEAMDDINIDPEAQIARVGPGNRAEDVLAETQEYGLATPTGSAGDVGISGQTLGGGIGWIRRKHGLSVDALRSVELVTADGELLKASPDHNEDLYWAVRGGGGNFGIVTNFEFDLYEVGPIVGGLGVFYPAEHVDEVLKTHREEIEDAPKELTTVLVNGHVPALPAIPNEIHGKDAIAILGCYAGDPGKGMEIIDPLRNVAEPIIDMSEPMPYEVLHDLGTQLYPWGRNYVHRSVFLDELNEAVHSIIRDQTNAAPGPMDAIAIWPMGGSVGQGEPSAFAWDDKQYMITIEANWEHYDNDGEFGWVRETERMLRDVGGEGAYAGFTGVEEQDWECWADQVYASNYDRLIEVKNEFDAANAFHHNVNIEPVDD